MKIGSVQFFKRLILGVVAALIVVPVALAIFFGVLYGKEKKRGQELTSVNQMLVSALQVYVQTDGDASAENQKLIDALLFSAEGAQNSALQGIKPSLPYQEMYPHLYAERPAQQTEDDMVCYLTFDDGPSATTVKVLSALAEHNIKATFFVTGRASELEPEAIRAAADAGHTIGVHTYSHSYTDIYASVEAYLEDFDKMYRRIEEITGTPPTVFRFPGGSVNVYNAKTYTAIAAEMLRRGFVFFDWNAAGSDAVVGGISAEQVTANVLSSSANKTRLVVLLHDRLNTATSAAALPGIIGALQDRGFRFEALTSAVKPVTYYVSE